MLLARKKFIVAEIEVTYGVDPTPTQAIETSEVEINPLAGPTVGRNLDRAVLGNDLQVLVGTYVELKFKVELSGSGTAGTPPKYADMLLACGLAATVVAVTSVTYNPVSTAFDSGTIYFKHDGQLHILTGARGNVALELDPGTLPHLVFSFMGLFTTPSSVPDGTPDFTGFEPALPVNNANTPTFTLHGESSVLEKLSIDLANQVEYRNVVGGESIEQYDRAPAGSCEIAAPAISVKDWFSVAQANTLDVLNFVHGTVGGNIVTVNGPLTQVISPKYAGENISTLAMQLGFMPGAAGDDDLSIAFT